MTAAHPLVLKLEQLLGTSVIIGMLVVAAGCERNSPGDRSTARSPTTSLATASAATDEAILAAYRAHWTDINVVATNYPVDATSPQLSEHMAGQELTQVQAQLALLAARHQYVVGPPVDSSMAQVKAVNGPAAVVTDCDLDSGAVKDALSGAVGQTPTQRTLVNARLDLIEGSWKVTQFAVARPGCTSPSS